MAFNPDPKKPAQEVLFSRKKSNITHRIIYFDNAKVQRANQQKHLGIILDEKLSLKIHIDKVLTKASKGIAVIKRLQNSFIKQLLDHILTMEIFCTTNLITLLFNLSVKKLNLFNQSSSCNYWCNSRNLTRRIGS